MSTSVRSVTLNNGALFSIQGAVSLVAPWCVRSLKKGSTILIQMARFVEWTERRVVANYHSVLSAEIEEWEKMGWTFTDVKDPSPKESTLIFKKSTTGEKPDVPEKQGAEIYIHRIKKKQKSKCLLM